jgi:hypothetical protein
MDSDAIAYIGGSYSFAVTGMYVDALGNPLNVFPPAYSYILSFFGDPLDAAYVINTVSLSFGIAITYILARQHDWNWYAATGLSLAIGFGFFRSIAGFAKPDMLGYALFLLAILGYSNRKGIWYLGSHFLLSLLIPLKHIAILFTPSALVSTWLEKSNRSLQFYFRSTLIFVGWALCLVGLILFNYVTIGAVVSASHPTEVNWGYIITELFVSFPRTFLSYWYGSIREPGALIAFVVMLATAMIAMTTLRPNPKGTYLARFGVTLFILSLLLLFVRGFSVTPRILGYAYILVLFGFIPRTRLNGIWILYAVVSISVGAYNMVTVSFGGINHPEYELLAHEVSRIPVPSGEIIYTNSADLLDIHLQIPSVLTTQTEDVPMDGYFLWISLPNYDPIMKTIIPMDRPLDLCLVTEIENAVLFQRCE